MVPLLPSVRVRESCGSIVTAYRWFAQNYSLDAHAHTRGYQEKIAILQPTEEKQRAAVTHEEHALD